MGGDEAAAATDSNGEPPHQRHRGSMADLSFIRLIDCTDRRSDTNYERCRERCHARGNDDDRNGSNLVQHSKSPGMRARHGRRGGRPLPWQINRLVVSVLLAGRLGPVQNHSNNAPTIEYVESGVNLFFRRHACAHDHHQSITEFRHALRIG